MRKKKLYVSQFDNPYLQENFKSLTDLFREIPYLKGNWVFQSIEIKTTGTNLKIPHGLAFQPLDVIVLSTIGGSVVFNYSLFDGTYLDLTATVTSSPMTIRAFIGRYSEDAVNV